MARPGRLLLHRLHLLRESYWFVPTVMAVMAIALAVIAVTLDERVGRLELGYWAAMSTAEGARLLLSTIAGSMITVAGVIFSITIAALAMTSSQFGPRLLKNFMRDRSNQVVLGTFTSTFLYCLLVLVSTGPVEQSGLQLSVIVAVVLALCSLAVLIYFIHHVAQSIQADHVIARVGGQLLRGIARLGQDTAPGEQPPTAPDSGRQVTASSSGYVQRLDLTALAEVAAEHDALIQVAAPTGSFVIGGAPLAKVYGMVAADDDAVARRVRKHFTLGNARSSEQDVGLLMDQLVELAQRALSPSINDPFSAKSCLDRLASGLAELARRPPVPATVPDDEGRVRVIVPVIDLPRALARTLDPIRRDAGRHVPVLERLIDVVREVAQFVARPEDLAPLREQADRIAAVGAELPTDADRHVIVAAHRRAAAALDAAGQRLGAGALRDG